MSPSLVAAYFDPTSESMVRQPIAKEPDLDEALSTVLATVSGRGHPALALHRPGGSALSLGTDGTVACLIWHDGVGDSFHSVGGQPGPPLVFDYMRSWSEVPHEWTVPLAAARDCLVAFMKLGEPSSDLVLFEPD